MRAVGPGRLVVVALLVAGALPLAVACGAPPPDESDAGDVVAGEGEGEGGDGPADSTETIPPDTAPCEHPEFWPHAVASSSHPILVHYRTRDDEETARTMVGMLDQAWRDQVDGLGMPAPLPDDLDIDAGEFGCGPDERLDVFVFAGLDEAYVDVVTEFPETPQEEYSAFMVVDPYGAVGGEFLGATIEHEFHHTTQAALDWLDAPMIYESSATFIEDELVPQSKDWYFTVVDVQDNPTWSLDRDDGYATFFMYGQALYLVYLRDAHFGGSPQFFVDMWKGMPSDANDEPDFEDVLDQLLTQAGEGTFFDSVAGYARWRWYTGDHDDGAHFADGALLPAPSASQVVVDQTRTVSLTPMLLGGSYVDVQGAGADVGVDVALPAGSGARVVVQAVPGIDGASDGEVLTLPARVPLSGGARTLVVTLLPDGPYDVDTRTDATVPVTLTLTP